MSDGLNFNLQGISEALDALDDLRDLPRKEVNSALRKVAKPIIRNARKNLMANNSIKTRRLYKSIKSLVISRKLPGLWVGPTKKGKKDASAPHAHLVEFGSKERKLDRPILLNFNGTWAYVSSTGKAKPKPFMAPAVEQSRDDIDRLAQKHITPIVQNQWRYD